MSEHNGVGFSKQFNNLICQLCEERAGTLVIYFSQLTVYPEEQTKHPAFAAVETDSISCTKNVVY